MEYRPEAPQQKQGSEGAWTGSDLKLIKSTACNIRVLPQVLVYYFKFESRRFKIVESRHRKLCFLGGSIKIPNSWRIFTSSEKNASLSLYKIFCWTFSMLFWLNWPNQTWIVLRKPAFVSEVEFLNKTTGNIYSNNSMAWWMTNAEKMLQTQNQLKSSHFQDLCWVRASSKAWWARNVLTITVLLCEKFWNSERNGCFLFLEGLNTVFAVSRYSPLFLATPKSSLPGWRYACMFKGDYRTTDTRQPHLALPHGWWAVIASH